MLLLPSSYFPLDFFPDSCCEKFTLKMYPLSFLSDFLSVFLQVPRRFYKFSSLTLSTPLMRFLWTPQSFSRVSPSFRREYILPAGFTTFFILFRSFFFQPFKVPAALLRILLLPPPPPHRLFFPLEDKSLPHVPSRKIFSIMRTFFILLLPLVLFLDPVNLRKIAFPPFSLFGFPEMILLSKDFFSVVPFFVKVLRFAFSPGSWFGSLFCSFCRRRSSAFYPPTSSFIELRSSASP